MSSTEPIDTDRRLTTCAPVVSLWIADYKNVNSLLLTVATVAIPSGPAPVSTTAYPATRTVLHVYLIMVPFGAQAHWWGTCTAVWLADNSWKRIMRLGQGWGDEYFWKSVKATLRKPEQAKRGTVEIECVRRKGTFYK